MGSQYSKTSLSNALINRTDGASFGSVKSQLESEVLICFSLYELISIYESLVRVFFCHPNTKFIGVFLFNPMGNVYFVDIARGEFIDESNREIPVLITSATISLGTNIDVEGFIRDKLFSNILQQLYRFCLDINQLHSAGGPAGEIFKHRKSPRAPLSGLKF